MRVFRVVFAGVLALAMMPVLGGAPTMAGPPSPPYRAFALWDNSGRLLPQAVAKTFDTTNANISMTAGEDNFTVETRTESQGWIDFSFSAPIGAHLTAGVTYPARRNGRTETHGDINIYNGGGSACDRQLGYLKIESIARSPENWINSIAASFSMGGCGDDDTQAIFGVIRFNTAVPVALTQPSQSQIDFGSTLANVSSSARAVTVTATGSVPATMGKATIADADGASFQVVSDGCAGMTLAFGHSCTVSVAANPTAAKSQSAILIVPNTTLGIPTTVRLSAAVQLSNRGAYYAITPSRILDTRFGNGAAGPVRAGQTVRLQVAGRGGIPTSGVSAVVLNVTVTAPTAAGYVTVYPTGVPRPTASSLNFAPGWTGANSVTVALGTNGQIDLFNNIGDTQLIADVVGYYAADNTLIPTQGYGGELQPVAPERLFDSRSEWGQRVPGGSSFSLRVAYGDQADPRFYNEHIRALAINVTAVDAAGSGYLTTWSGASPMPVASTLNFSPGAVVPNFAIVPTSLCYGCDGTTFPIPTISIYTSMSVHVVVDIVGFYDDGELADGVHDGLRFTPQTPSRIVDSRLGQGLPAALGQQATGSVASAGLPPATKALALNVTAVSPTATTFIAVWPHGMPRPTVSTLNPSAGQIIPNAAMAILGSASRFDLYNNAGSVHIVVDQVGTFFHAPGLATGGSVLQGGARQPILTAASSSRRQG
jgi:hypothetical protein